MTLEELRIVISASTEPLRKEMENVKKQLSGIEKETAKTTSGIKNIFKKLLIGVVALKIGQKIGEAIVGGIKEAMNVEAAIQQIKRIMGESSNQFLKWADTQAIAFNMSKGQAVKYGSIFGNLVSGFSSSTAEITKNTEDLLKASSVIASATGRTMDDVMERIRSGLLGNTEAIEDLGVNVNVAMIQSTDAFKKFANGKSWDQLNFQTQQQIRLMAILEQTTKKYGDAVNQNTSTQLAQLVAQLNNVKLSLGQAFLPIVQIILPVLTQFASGLAYVMNIVAQFSQALFGKSVQTGNKQAQGTQAQAKAMTNLGNATEKAGKQAKGALAGFDEINQLQMDDGSGTDGGNGVGSGTPITPGVDMGGMTDNVGGIAPEIQAMADKVKAALAGIDFQPLTDSFGKIKTAIEPLTEMFFSGLKWFFDNILVPFAGWTIEDLIPSFFNLLASALNVITPILEALNPLLLFLWNNFLQPITSWTGGVIVEVLNQLSNVLNIIGGWASNNLVILTAAISGLAAGFATFLIISNIPNIISAFETLYLAMLYVKDFIIGALSGALGFLASPIGIIVAAVALLTAGFVYFYTTNESFRGVVDEILNQIKDVALNLWNNVLAPFGNFLKDVFVAAWGAVTTAATWLWKNVLVPIGDFLLWFWNNVLVPVGGILVDILGVAFKFVADVAKSLWENVLVPLANFFKDTFAPTVEAVEAVFKFLWERALTPIATFLAEVFKGAWEIIINVLEFLWNDVLKPLAIYLGNDFLSIFNTVFEVIGGVINGIKETFIGLMHFITGVFTGDWSKAWEGIKEIFGGIGYAIGSIAQAIIGVFSGIVSYLVDTFVGLWTGTWNVIKEFFGGIAYGIALVAQAVIGVFNGITTFLIDTFSVLWTNVWDGIKAVFGGVKDYLSSIWGGIKQIFDGIINFVVGVFTGDWDRAWSGVKEIFRAIFDSLYSIVKTPLNLIIDAINFVIRGLNKLQIDVPDWVSKITGISGTWGFNISQIPKLARGGIIDQPTLAMVGEAGKEAVVPLENTSFVDKLASALGTAVMAAMQFSSGSSNNNTGDVIIQLDGTTLARILNPYSERESARIGNSMIVTT